MDEEKDENVHNDGSGENDENHIMDEGDSVFFF